MADLLEAEGRALRRSIFRSSAGLVLLASAGILGLAGLGFCLFGVYVGLETPLGSTAAALLTGLAALMLMLVMVWIATRISR